MIRVCILSLFIYGLNAQCGPQSSDTCESADPGGDWTCCVLEDDDSCTPRLDAVDCVRDTDMGSSTTTEVPCDDSDLNEWRVDYIGMSTQFRIYNPCNDKFIKFKMEDLTEYNGQTDKKTNNKETSFASSKDWEWGTDSGVTANYKGNDAILNVFDADQLTDGTTSFQLNTWFFKDPTNITDPDDENSTITIYPNTLKFDTIIENWSYLDSDNYLVLCIGIMTNNAGDIDDDPDTKTFYLQEFAITNVATASCVDSNGDSTNINVTVDRSGNGNNHLDLCYTFDPCDGDIRYDPIVSLNGDGTSAAMSVFGNTLGAFIMVCLWWLL